MGWMMIEVIFFSSWIGAGIIFLLYSKLTKAKRFLSVELVPTDESDIWTMRQTEDYLKHMKTEFFERCYMLAMILCEIQVGFFGFDKMDKYGPRSRSSDRMVLIIAMLPRFIDVFVWVAYQALGLNGRSVWLNRTRKALLICDTVFLVAYSLLFVAYDEDRKSRNIVLAMWFRMEFCAKGCEMVHRMLRIWVFPAFFSEYEED